MSVGSGPYGLPCFPHSVNSIACFGNAYPKITVTAKAAFGNRNDLSEMTNSPSVDKGVCEE
jgi:hypothetical protein